ncbi:non-homologous end joining protein Ku [Rhizobium grahamii]|uniref:Non-homologous end joining protein Ku n=1 Tax=Rhizobium grahamii CCGE 502 TaxID=990285 RepID=S3HUE5_9HYPH|nr:Ku protein [Rhizobium grahamii]EPE96811.1 Ku protein [Rhizobium grahamii CCGE 502]
MAANRAQWKGHIKIGEISCAVGLYTAASTSERISFHTINKATGNRVRREFIDSETDKVVEREDQVKGFETTAGDYIMIDPEEVAAVIPESDKTLDLEAFIPCSEVDDLYFDKPYYLVPSDDVSEEPFAALRDAMIKSDVVAISRTVLFRRMRTVLIRAHDRGMIATTLNFDYEVRPSDQAFKDIPDIKVEDEMLDLAKHIIETKKGDFDPSTFDDRYENAVAELVKAKAEGRALPKAKPIQVSKPNELLKALRESAGFGGAKSGGAKRKTKAANANASKSGKTAASKSAAKATRKKAS